VDHHPDWEANVAVLDAEEAPGHPPEDDGGMDRRELGRADPAGGLRSAQGGTSQRSRHWLKDTSTAGQAYRFVLTNPHVNVCLTAPRSKKELLANLAAQHSDPLPEDEMAIVREDGDVVHEHARWFM
jgi:hypothetical protein